MHWAKSLACSYSDLTLLSVLLNADDTRKGTCQCCQRQCCHTLTRCCQHLRNSTDSATVAYNVPEGSVAMACSTNMKVSYRLQAGRRCGHLSQCCRSLRRCRHRCCHSRRRLHSTKARQTGLICESRRGRPAGPTAHVGIRTLDLGNSHLRPSSRGWPQFRGWRRPPYRRSEQRK